MRAILLAAGQGQRLMPYTRDIPKCLVELGDRPLLMHQIDVLNAAGIEDIRIVTGYRSDRIKSLGYPTILNSCFSETNMVASLMCAAGLMDGTDDVLIAYSDIVYEPHLIHEIQACNSPLATVVDRQWRRLWEARFDDPLDDAETLRLNGDGCITDIGRRPESYDQIEGQYVGLTRVAAGYARGFVDFFGSITQAGMDVARMGMTTFLRILIAAGWPLEATLVDGGWLDVDKVSDLELYRALHDRGELDTYWRMETVSEMCHA